MPGMTKMHKFFQEKAKEFGNIIAFHTCNKYVIVLNGREVIQEALVKQSQTFADRPRLYMTTLFKDYRGFLNRQYDEDFRKLHKLCLNILKKCGFGQGTMETRIRIEVENMLTRFISKNGKAFDPKYETTASVSNVICNIIFGRSSDLDDPKLNERINNIHLLVANFEKTSLINLFPILRFLPIFSGTLKSQVKLRERWNIYMSSMLEGIADVNEEDSFYKILKTKTEADADLGDLIQKEYTECLLNVIRDLSLAGTETTATTIQWFMITMANHQDIQKQIRDEMDQVVGLKRHPSLDDKPNLPLLEATLLELMRLKTLLPLSLAHSTLKDTYLNGLFIPANTIVFPNLYSCHMDPTVWKEPEKFDISRFLDETKTKVVNKDQVVSFSLGKRSCLGGVLARQEVFLFASALVHEFEIHPPIGQDRIDDSEHAAVLNIPKPFEARFIRRLCRK